MQARQARHRGCQPTKGSSRLVGGDTYSAWAQDMRLDNVGGITGRTAAGLCEPAERYISKKCCVSGCTTKSRVAPYNSFAPVATVAPATKVPFTSQRVTKSFFHLSHVSFVNKFFPHVTTLLSFFSPVI